MAILQDLIFGDKCTPENVQWRRISLDTRVDFLGDHSLFQAPRSWWKSRSVKRNAKNLLGLGRDRAAIFPAATAPFPKSCASYFRFVRFNTFPLYYLRAWHRLRGPVLLYVIHKSEIRHFHVVVVQWQQRNVQKSVMHVQSCCFAYYRWCYTGRFATTIFSATQRGNVGTML